MWPRSTVQQWARSSAFTDTSISVFFIVKLIGRVCMHTDCNCFQHLANPTVYLLHWFTLFFNEVQYYDRQSTEVQYYDRQGTAHRLPSSRLGSSTSRHSVVVSTRLAMQEVAVLGQRIDDITESVAETQRDVKRLLDMMETSNIFKSRSNVSGDAAK